MNKTPTFEIVKAILDRGNGPGLITEWFDGLKKWAEANPSPDAEALKIWLDISPARPFYTAQELARFWTPLKMTLGLSSRLDPAPGANRLHNELVFHRLPLLRNYLTGGFDFGPDRYFIVEHVHRWKERALTPTELQAVLNGEKLP